MWQWKSTLVLVLAFVAGAQGKVWAQTATPEGLVDLFVTSWNTHDMKGFDRLFADDAVFVPLAEVRVKGRVEIVKGLAETHADWAKTTTLAPSGVEVLKERPDVAVIFFHARLDEEGQKGSGKDRAVMFVAVKAKDGWRVVAGQMTKESPS